MYPINALGVGAHRSPAPEDYRADVDAMLAKVTDRTRVVCLANPNSPTGTRHQGRRAPPKPACRRTLLLVIDAAYAEYVSRNDYRSGVELVDGRKRSDPHLLEDLRHGRIAARLDVPARRHRRCDQPAAPAVQHEPRGAGSGYRGARDIARTDASRPATTSGCRGFPRDGRSKPEARPASATSSPSASARGTRGGQRLADERRPDPAPIAGYNLPAPAHHHRHRAEVRRCATRSPTSSLKVNE